MRPTEFELIERYFRGCDQGPAVVLGVGDDAAVVRGQGDWAVCMDTLVAGVHFPVDAPPASVGHKALAVNLSDLAAMGADPSWFQLALTLPEVDEGWLQAFSQGLRELAEACGVALVGGDTTRGPLAITVQAAGTLPQGRMLRRAGAKAGDDVYVSGSLGDAAAGLHLWQQGARESALVERLHRPTPRLALGRFLHGIAAAAIDVSDGLAADLGHVLTASGVGAVVDVERLPLSAALREAVPEPEARELALSGGDDYELCFTAPRKQRDEIAALSTYLSLPLTRIGSIEAEPGLRLRAQGRPYTPQRGGYEHFSEDSR